MFLPYLVNRLFTWSVERPEVPFVERRLKVSSGEMVCQSRLVNSAARQSGQFEINFPRAEIVTLGGGGLSPFNVCEFAFFGLVDLVGSCDNVRKLGQSAKDVRLTQFYIE